MRKLENKHVELFPFLQGKRVEDMEMNQKEYLARAAMTTFEMFPQLFDMVVVDPARQPRLYKVLAEKLGRSLPVFMTSARLQKREVGEQVKELVEEFSGLEKLSDFKKKLTIDEKIANFFPTFEIYKGEKVKSEDKSKRRAAMFCPGIDFPDELDEKVFSHALSNYDFVIKVNFPENFSELSLAGYMAFLKYWGQKMTVKYGQLDIIAFSFSGGVFVDLLNTLLLREINLRIWKKEKERPGFSVKLLSKLDFVGMTSNLEKPEEELIDIFVRAVRRLYIVAGALGLEEITDEWVRNLRTTVGITEALDLDRSSLISKILENQSGVQLERPRYLVKRVSLDKMGEKLTKSFKYWCKITGKKGYVFLDYVKERLMRKKVDGGYESDKQKVLGLVGGKDEIISWRNFMVRLNATFGFSSFKLKDYFHRGPVMDEELWEKFTDEEFVLGDPE